MRAITWLKWLMVILVSGFVFAIGMASVPDPIAIPVSPSLPAEEVRPRGPVGVSLVLETRRSDERMYYMGAEGLILGLRNPDLVVHKGDLVSLTLINGLDTVSDIAVPTFGVESGLLIGRGARTTMVFTPGKVGDFLYASTFPELRAEGLIGRFVVEPAGDIPQPMARVPRR